MVEKEIVRHSYQSSVFVCTIFIVYLIKIYTITKDESKFYATVIAVRFC